MGACCDGVSPRSTGLRMNGDAMARPAVRVSQVGPAEGLAQNVMMGVVFSIHGFCCLSIARVYICLFAPSGRRSDQAPEALAKKCDSPRSCSSSRRVAIGEFDSGRSGVPCGLRPASRAAITSGYRLFDSSGQRCDHPMRVAAPCSKKNTARHRDSTLVADEDDLEDSEEVETGLQLSATLAKVVVPIAWPTHGACCWRAQ